MSSMDKPLTDRERVTAMSAAYPDATADLTWAEIGELLSPSPNGSGEQVAMIEAMVAGTAPMSKWVASVDYSTCADFEEYLKSQLREKLHLKASLDGKRKDSDHDEALASFVDGGTAALEGALATYRIVMERSALSTSMAGPVPDGWREQLREAVGQLEIATSVHGQGGPDTAAECWEKIEDLLAVAPAPALPPVDKSLADVCLVMARDICEKLVGKQYRDSDEASIAEFIYRCATTGGRALYASPVRVEREATDAPAEALRKRLETMHGDQLRYFFGMGRFDGVPDEELRQTILAFFYPASRTQP